MSVVFSDNGVLKQLVFEEGKTAEILPGVEAPAPSAPVAVPIPGGENKQAVIGGGAGTVRVSHISQAASD